MENNFAKLENKKKNELKAALGKKKSKAGKTLKELSPVSGLLYKPSF
jgi:hypothetical protein